jgi:hypothetical protein
MNNTTGRFGEATADNTCTAVCCDRTCAVSGSPRPAAPPAEAQRRARPGRAVGGAVSRAAAGAHSAVSPEAGPLLMSNLSAPN